MNLGQQPAELCGFCVGQAVGQGGVGFEDQLAQPGELDLPTLGRIDSERAPVGLVGPPLDAAAIFPEIDRDRRGGPRQAERIAELDLLQAGIAADQLEHREALRRDPAIRVRDAKRLVGLYYAKSDLAHPRLTLDVAGGRPLPPTLVQAGGAEMLVGDARRLASDIIAAGGECKLQVWPDQVHVFQALPRLTPDAAPAMRNIARFIAESLGDYTAGQEAG